MLNQTLSETAILEVLLFANGAVALGLSILLWRVKGRWRSDVCVQYPTLTSVRLCARLVTVEAVVLAMLLAAWVPPFPTQYLSPWQVWLVRAVVAGLTIYHFRWFVYGAARPRELIAACDRCGRRQCEKYLIQCAALLALGCVMFAGTAVTIIMTKMLANILGSS